MAYASIEDVQDFIGYSLDSSQANAVEIFLEFVADNIEDAYIDAKIDILEINFARAQRVSIMKAQKFIPLIGRDTSVTYESLTSGGGGSESSSYRNVDLESLADLTSRDRRILRLPSGLRTIKYSVDWGVDDG